MTFLQFLESRYVTTNIELQSEFSLFKQAETRAGQYLINGQRRVYIYICYAKLISLFLGMKIGLVKKPKDSMELAKELAEKQKASKVTEDSAKLQMVTNPK